MEDLALLSILRSETQRYIDNKLKQAQCDVNLAMALQALEIQKTKEILYVQILDNLADPLVKAKEIKEMLSICEKHPKLGPCIRLKALLKKRQYQLSSLI